MENILKKEPVQRVQKKLDEYNQNNESVGNSLGDILKEQIDK